MFYSLVIARDGYCTSAGFTYPRWAICLSRDGKVPAFHWRNGGPRSLVRPTASKAPPQWMERAVGFVRAMGGLTFEDCDTVVNWFKTHRTGTPADLFAVAAK